MENNWRPSTWGDEISLEYGKSLKGYRESNGTVPVFGSNGAVGWTDEALADGPGVILGRKGAYRGVRYSKDPFFVIDTAYYVKPKTKLDMRWLYYAILHHKLGEIDDGSPIPSTTRSAVYVSDVDIPPLPEQKAIAHILGSLDDKIALNRRMNATLEAIAQALFKSWFVDFDPVIDNALTAGNPIPAEFAQRAEIRRRVLTAGTANRAAAKNFPAAFQLTKELGWIPEGWESITIKDCCEIVQNGGTPKRSESKYWNSNDIPWLTSGEVRQNIIYKTEQYISDSGLKNSSAKWLCMDSTVVAMYGATAGQVSFVAIPLTTNQAICGLIPKQNHRYFNFLALSNFVGSFENQARGSAQQNISKGIVEAMPVITATQCVMQRFDEICVPLFNKWVSNLNTVETLTKLRDTLLPKLISGELRVPDAEKLVNEAIL